MKNIKYLYHATPEWNVESIMENGLIPDFKLAGVTGGVKIRGVIELDSSVRGLRNWLNKSGHIKSDWVILGIDIKYLEKSRLRKSKVYIEGSRGKRRDSTWFRYEGIISPKAIHIVGGIMHPKRS